MARNLDAVQMQNGYVVLVRTPPAVHVWQRVVANIVQLEGESRGILPCPDLVQDRLGHVAQLAVGARVECQCRPSPLALALARSLLLLLLLLWR